MTARTAQIVVEVVILVGCGFVLGLVVCQFLN